MKNKEIICEKCGSNLITSYMFYNECCNCGETFLNGLEDWFFNIYF